MVNQSNTRRARPRTLEELLTQLYERVRRIENRSTVSLPGWTLSVDSAGALVATNTATGAVTTLAT